MCLMCCIFTWYHSMCLNCYTMLTFFLLIMITSNTFASLQWQFIVIVLMGQDVFCLASLFPEVWTGTLHPVHCCHRNLIMLFLLKYLSVHADGSILKTGTTTVHLSLEERHSTTNQQAQTRQALISGFSFLLPPFTLLHIKKLIRNAQGRDYYFSTLQFWDQVSRSLSESRLIPS